MLTVFRRPNDYLIPGIGTVSLDGWRYLIENAKRNGFHTLLVWAESGWRPSDVGHFPDFKLVTALSLDPHGGN